jgi:CRISPR/Cas system CMR subunit Cmr6 (Cas7 group RAMP superfamily)
MERKIYIVLLLIIACITTNAHKSQAYNSFINNKMKEWKTIIDSLEEQNVLDFNLVNYYYGYVAWCIDKDKEDEGEEYLERVESLLDKLKLKTKNKSLIYAYKSALIGFEIGLDFFKAPLIGMYAMKYANKSVELDNKNYFAYLQIANNYFYTPKIFGGSTKKALTYYLQSEKLIKEKKHNWNYINLLVSICRNYVELEDKENALKYYQKILIIEPNFKWLKTEFYENNLKNI